MGRTALLQPVRLNLGAYLLPGGSQCTTVLGYVEIDADQMSHADIDFSSHSLFSVSSLLSKNRRHGRSILCSGS